jgi:hypothetical protein
VVAIHLAVEPAVLAPGGIGFMQVAVLAAIVPVEVAVPVATSLATLLAKPFFVPPLIDLRLTLIMRAEPLGTSARGLPRLLNALPEFLAAVLPAILPGLAAVIPAVAPGLKLRLSLSLSLGLSLGGTLRTAFFEDAAVDVQAFIPACPLLPAFNAFHPLLLARCALLGAALLNNGALALSLACLAPLLTLFVTLLIALALTTVAFGEPVARVLRDNRRRHRRSHQYPKQCLSHRSTPHTRRRSMPPMDELCPSLDEPLMNLCLAARQGYLTRPAAGRF